MSQLKELTETIEAAKQKSHSVLQRSRDSIGEIYQATVAPLEKEHGELCEKHRVILARLEAARTMLQAGEPADVPTKETVLAALEG